MEQEWLWRSAEVSSRLNYPLILQFGCSQYAAKQLSGAGRACWARAGGEGWEGQRENVLFLLTPLHCPWRVRSKRNCHIHSTVALETPKAATKMGLEQEKWLGILLGSPTRAAHKSCAGVGSQQGNVGSLLPAPGAELHRLSLGMPARGGNQGWP